MNTRGQSALRIGRLRVAQQREHDGRRRRPAKDSDSGPASVQTASSWTFSGSGGGPTDPDGVRPSLPRGRVSGIVPKWRIPPFLSIDQVDNVILCHSSAKRFMDVYGVRRMRYENRLRKPLSVAMDSDHLKYRVDNDGVRTPPELLARSLSRRPWRHRRVAKNLAFSQSAAGEQGVAEPLQTPWAGPKPVTDVRRRAIQSLDATLGETSSGASRRPLPRGTVTPHACRRTRKVTTQTASAPACIDG